MNGTSSPGIPSQRHLFDIPEGISYLNCAYMGPLMHSVIEAGEKGLKAKARPWEIATSDFFTETERARELCARVINADVEGIALVPSASYGLSCAARNLEVMPGERIIVLADQFPSNVYAWREVARSRGAGLVTVPRPYDADWTQAVLTAIGDAAAVVALPHCHWSDGGWLDLERIGMRCRDVGASLVLDLTQSGGAMRFDTAVIQPDYLVCAGYKWLLGPYSLGFLWVAPEHREGKPIEFNWSARAGAEDFERLVHYRDAYRPGARRFDVGENANFVLVPMLNTALEKILEWGVDRIEKTLSIRTAEIADRAVELGLQSVPRGLRAGHLLGLRLEGGEPPAGLAARLAAEQVYVSVRGTSIRVTPHLYNTDEDVERFFAVLSRLLKQTG